MPQDATCPNCAHPFPVTEARHAFTVACPRCDAEMTVEFRKPAAPPEAGRPHADLLVKPGALPTAPTAPPRRSREIDDADEPRRKGGSLALVFVSAALGGVVTLGGLGLTAWVLFTQIDTSETVAARPGNKPGSPKGGLVNPFGPPTGPGTVPPIEPPPGRLELPPLPEPVAITAAPVAAETAYKLPEPVRAVRVGGGGRFLILHLPKARKFGVFDASEAKIVRYIDASEDDVFFAAGMTKLVVYLPGSQTASRYDLLTGEREHVGKLALPAGRVEAFCMGHASAGPLLVSVADKGAALYDLAQFNEIRLPGEAGNAQPRLEGGFYWAGATGRVFGYTGTYGQPNGVKTVVLEGSGAKRYGEHQGTWFVMPGPDDKYVYPGGYGVVSERVRPVANVPFSMGTGAGFASHLYLPAHHGPFYLHASTIDGFGQKDAVPVGTIRLFMHGSKEPVATYAKTAVCKYGWEGLRGLGIEHSVHLIPRAKLLVVVPEARDELRLYPADLEAALDAAGRDYLLVTSAPPAHYRKGTAFAYQIEVTARKGPVTFRLATGPKGMTVSAAGAVRWAVPAGFADGRVDVILSIKDATGQEVFHTLTLTDAG